jgi:hypothetical protein
MPGQPLDLGDLLPPAEVLDEGARVIGAAGDLAQWAAPASTASIATAAAATSSALRTCLTHTTPSRAKAAAASSSTSTGSMAAL